MCFKKKSQEFETKVTPLCEFVKINGKWEGLIEVEDPEFEEGGICLIIGDVEGEPNAQVLNFIPYVITHLPMLEQAARKGVSKLTAEHVLAYVSDFNPEADFSLNFCEERNWGEMVCVDIKNGKVTDWWSWD